VRLAAIRDWLDRAAITSKIEVEIDMPWKDVIAGIVAEVDEDQVNSAQNYAHRLTSPAPELENYVDAEVIEEDLNARAEAERIKGRPASEWASSPNSQPSPAPGRRQPTGPRSRQADVRAD
jgi:hypothetical protein